jgi:hypothetical protein
MPNFDNSKSNVQWVELFRAMKIANSEHKKTRKTLRESDTLHNFFTESEIANLKNFNLNAWLKNNQIALQNYPKAAEYLKQIAEKVKK